MRTLVLAGFVAALVMPLAAGRADAQSYYSRQSTQARDYQRLQQATRRAYAPPKVNNTYRPPARTQTYRAPTTTTTTKRTYR